MHSVLGVAVTTHDRDVLDETLDAVLHYTPQAHVLVVDDGSREPKVVPAGVHLVRHPQALGIAQAKNRCIAGLMAAGCEHLFLLDDDTRPAARGWWRPYTRRRELHCQYSWTHYRTGQPVPDVKVVHRTRWLVGYTWSMGCALYVHASVVQRVGGMDPRFGMCMEEHGEWSERIHSAGFTSFAHQDAAEGRDLWWAGDEHQAVARSYSGVAQHLEPNRALRRSLVGSTRFVPYQD